jgi:hypothetical protein
MNTYEQPENKLTYNFLWLIQYLNNVDFLSFITGRRDISHGEPIKNIETVFGGGESNPDGAITIELENGNIITIYIESKTVRRGIDLDQLNRHIKNYLKNEDLLLVITPRESDRVIINSVSSKSIIFCTWQDISRYIEKKHGHDIIVKEFIEYGNLKGEFLVMKDIEKADLDIIMCWYKNNIANRLSHVFYSLSEEIIELFKEFGIDLDSAKFADHWGRQGIEISFKKPKFGLWAFFGLYYDDSDHKIPFIYKDEGIPDICLFIDLNPNESRKKIDGDEEIKADFRILEKYGFRCNDNGRLTKNRWRLISHQKSLKDFDSLSKETLKNELRNILKKFFENSKCFFKYI